MNVIIIFAVALYIAYAICVVVSVHNAYERKDKEEDEQ